MIRSTPKLFWTTLFSLAVAETAATKTICTGDLSNRRIGQTLGVPLNKACISEDGQRAQMTALLEDGPVELQGRVEKSTRRGETVYRNETRIKNKNVGVTVRMKAKDRIRFEGAMADHFVGSIEIAERGRGGQKHLLDGIHFYSGDPDHEIHWGYHPENGPDFWGKLNHEWEACLTGTRQSPIRLSAAESRNSPPDSITFNYRSLPGSLVNNGHALQVNVPGGSSFTVNGKTYHLLQFHAHTPSEHIVEGKVYPMEVHLVHQADDKSKAVIGVLVDTQDGTPNEALAAALKEFPKKINDPKEFSRKVNPANWLPPAGQRSYFSYAGSLTTPPCSEGVSWYVLDTPIKVAQDQVDKVRELIGGKNARHHLHGDIVFSPEGREVQHHTK